MHRPVQSSISDFEFEVQDSSNFKISAQPLRPAAAKAFFDSSFFAFLAATVTSLR